MKGISEPVVFALNRNLAWSLTGTTMQMEKL